MPARKILKRRGFVKLCASAAATVGASPALLAAAGSGLHRYERVRLVDREGHPLGATSLEPGRSYVFNYPYRVTPCFLLDLGRPALANGALRTEDGRRYRWAGGTGPRRSVVAFCAICTHKMTHPSRSVSFIDYRDETVRFVDAAKRPAHRAHVIQCCSEGSVYDPADGARVLGGPARQPLAAIAVELDPGDGALWASGVYGGELYDRFFAKFGSRLELEYATTHIHERVRGATEVVPIEEYSAHTIHCS